VASEAGICNRALLRIGVSATIDSLEEPTNEARACKVLYADTRDAVLEAYPWPWATKRAQLARLEGEARSGWAFAYALPADCISAQGIWCGTRNPTQAQRIPFALEHGAAGRILLCDHEAPELLYTARVTDPNRFPPLFIDAVAWALAPDLAIALGLEEGIAARARAQYRLVLSQAAAQAFSQRQADPEPVSELLSARW
jgi:hypothetical protein